MGHLPRRGGRGRGGGGGGGGGGGQRGGGGAGRSGRGGGGRGNGSSGGMQFVPPQVYGFGLGYGANAANSNAFSLRDEARNTGHHHGRDGTTPIRHGTISFVSAGTMDPQVLMKPVEPESIPDPEESFEPKIYIGAEPSYSTDEYDDGEDDIKLADNPASTEIAVDVTMFEEMTINKPEPTEDVPFVIDIITAKTNRGPNVLRNPRFAPPENVLPLRSVSRASSSGEEIVFVPKNRRGNQSATTSAGVARSRSKSKSKSPERQNIVHNQAPSVVVINDPIIVTQPLPTEEPAETIPPISKTRAKKNRKKAKKKKRAYKAERSLQEEDEEAILADYIAHMDMEIDVDDMFNIKANQRDIGGENSWEDASDDEDENENEQDEGEETKLEDDGQFWRGFEVEDFDVLSTSDEADGVIEVILGKRARPSGLQYLIKWVGLDIDDSTWVLAESLDSWAKEHVLLFEEREAETLAQMEESSVDSDDSDDDARLRRKMAQEKSDFKFAKRLAGYSDSDDEDVLFEGDEDDGFELDNIIAVAKGAMAIDRKKGKFPNATRLAQAYEAFDPMDWASPANVAPKKKKKNKAKMKDVWEISDEELQAQIENSWEKDRRSKKAKKAVRESLRAEGLLGNSGRTDLKAKYKEGLDMDELQRELTEFMLNPGRESFALPPMEKGPRKTVHNIASLFNLKSKSQGSGRKRFPVLYKTSTSTFFEGNAHIIETTFASSAARRFLPRSDRGFGKGVGSSKGRRTFAGKSSGADGHTHRDGDIVGAVAPELSMENKGRLMLEKMGYKTGMALGAAGNKGIVAPIFAVVKTSKAGLG